MFSGFRGRFGRRRHTEARGRAIDESWLRKLAAALPVESLSRVSCEGVPESFALLATGRDAAGREWLAAVSPRSGLDATLAVALAALRGLGGVEATRVAASAEWTSAGRRLCAELRVGGRVLRALELEGDGEDRGGEEALHFLPAERIAASLPSAEARDLFARAAEGLRGLAAKHGGVLRSAGGELELVIAAAAIAALRAEGDEPTLEIRVPTRASHGLHGGQLAEVLDRLEGQVRKRLNEGATARTACALGSCARSRPWWRRGSRCSGPAAAPPRRPTAWASPRTAASWSSARAIGSAWPSSRPRSRPPPRSIRCCPG